MQILKFVLFLFSFSVQGLSRGAWTMGFRQGLAPVAFAEGLAGLLQVI